MNQDMRTLIECQFNDLFNSLSDKEKMDITNHIFNMGLPGFPHLINGPKQLRIGQNFLNALPIQLKEPLPDIFYSNDSEFLKDQISLFVQKILSDPIQNQRSE